MVARVDPVTPFEVGRTYRRRDLQVLDGGQAQGGISTPRDHSCHREIHQGSEGATLNKRLEVRLGVLEAASGR